MRAKERPHLTRCIDAAAGRSDEPLRKRLAARPGMASSPEGVKHYGRVVSTVRVFAAGDIGRHRGFGGVGFAPVPSSPIRRPCRDARKRLGGNPRSTRRCTESWDQRSHETRSSAPVDGLYTSSTAVSEQPPPSRLPRSQGSPSAATTHNLDRSRCPRSMLRSSSAAERAKRRCPTRLGMNAARPVYAAMTSRAVRSLSLPPSQ